jgi:hypothetical protein
MGVVVVHVPVIVPGSVAVAVRMAVGGGGKHPEMLYYNITGVHRPEA